MPKLTWAAALLALPSTALAHHVSPTTSPWSAWNPEPWLVALLAASAVLYALGVRALWRKAGRGHGIRPAQVARFALGWICLAVALLSPLDAVAADSFAIHMIQHELLMVVAAPLLVLGRPLEAWAWALSRDTRRTLAVVARAPGLAASWRRLTEPVGAWCAHAVALWVWHLPVLFTAALADEGLHVFQHACFFGSALAFWWSVFGRDARTAAAISMASLLTTMLHTGALGALLTFAPSPWYYHTDASLLGLSTLEDQQLGGLVMWAPGSLAYLLAALALAARWLRASPASSRTADSSASS